MATSNEVLIASRPAREGGAEVREVWPAWRGRGRVRVGGREHNWRVTATGVIGRAAEELFDIVEEGAAEVGDGEIPRKFVRVERHKGAGEDVMAVAAVDLVVVVAKTPRAEL